MSDKKIMDVSKNTLPAMSSRVMFWRPRYMAESNWLEHIPFYFWLIEAQHPELIFEPELQSGVTYFALCQAVDKLNTDTRCIASFSNDCKEIERVTQYNDDHYQEFSLLSPEAGTLSIEDIDEGELDLLILKYNSEMIFDKKTMDIWQKKLSTRSIVLIHGSQKKEIKPLCRKLKEEYQTFEFNHGQGLLIVFTGSAQTAKMEALISLKGNTSGTRVMQDVYSRLGQVWREIWLNVNSKDTIKELEKQVLSTREELIILEQEKSSITSKLKKVSNERKAISATNQTLQSSVELRFNELATLTTLLQQAENELQTAKVELESLKDKHGKLKESSSVERVTLEKEVKSLAKQLNDKKLEKDNMLSELDDFRKVVKEQQNQISILKKNNESLEKDQQQIERSIETLAQENRKLESLKDKHGKLKESSSVERVTLEKEVKSLAKQLNDKKLEKDNMLSEIDDFRKVVKEQQNQISMLKKNNESLEKDQQQVARSIETLAQESRKLESLKEKNNKLRESYSVERVTLEKEVKSLAKQLHDKQLENDNVVSELDDVRKVAQEQQSQISRLKQNNELLEKDQQQAARSIETLTLENRKLEQSMQQRFDELAVLTGMLDEKTMQTQGGKAKDAVEATKISKAQKNFSFKRLVKKSSTKEKMKRNITLIKDSGLFDESWYTKTYPAAANNKNGVIAHYLEQGAKEGCNPSPLFSHNGYLNTYPDVKDAGANPLLHYIKFGKGEGRYIERV